MRFREELDVLSSQLFGLLLFLVRDVFECVGHTPQVITSLFEHLLPKRMKLLWREHFTCNQHYFTDAPAFREVGHKACTT